MERCNCFHVIFTWFSCTEKECFTVMVGEGHLRVTAIVFIDKNQEKAICLLVRKILHLSYPHFRLDDVFRPSPFIILTFVQRLSGHCGADLLIVNTWNITYNNYPLSPSVLGICPAHKL